LWLAARAGTPKMMRLLIARGADPLFVHHSVYYDPTIGSVATANVGIDAPRLTETSTVLMAALGVGGPVGEGWATIPDPKEREAQALEAVQLALANGVGINAVNRFDRTCKVPWTIPAGQVRECKEVEKPDQDLHGRFSPARTALEAARMMGFKSVIQYLQEKGGIGADVPVTPPRTTHQ
jgi:hypothetical protein